MRLVALDGGQLLVQGKIYASWHRSIHWLHGSVGDDLFGYMQKFGACLQQTPHSSMDVSLSVLLHENEASAPAG